MTMLELSHLKSFHQQHSEEPQFKEITAGHDVKTLICSECGTNFSSNRALENHMVKMHSSHVNTFPCELCGSFLKTQENLEIHHRLVHSVSDSSHLCGECGKVYKHSSQLRMHVLRYHSGEVFSCGQCEMTFISRMHLKRHITIRHTEKSFQCDQCDRTFHRPIALKTHIASVHDKLKPFYCELCDFKCARLSNLHLHRKKTHNLVQYSKEMLIKMVENDEHPKYTRADLAMLKDSFV